MFKGNNSKKFQTSFISFFIEKKENVIYFIPKYILIIEKLEKCLNKKQ